MNMRFGTTDCKRWLGHFRGTITGTTGGAIIGAFASIPYIGSDNPDDHQNGVSIIMALTLVAGFCGGVYDYVKAYQYKVFPNTDHDEVELTEIRTHSAPQSDVKHKNGELKKLIAKTLATEKPEINLLDITEIQKYEKHIEGIRSDAEKAQALEQFKDYKNYANDKCPISHDEFTKLENAITLCGIDKKTNIAWASTYNAQLLMEYIDSENVYVKDPLTKEALINNKTLSIENGLSNAWLVFADGVRSIIDKPKLMYAQTRFFNSTPVPAVKQEPAQQLATLGL